MGLHAHASRVPEARDLAALHASPEPLSMGTNDADCRAWRCSSGCLRVGWRRCGGRPRRRCAPTHSRAKAGLCWPHPLRWRCSLSGWRQSYARCVRALRGVQPETHGSLYWRPGSERLLHAIGLLCAYQRVMQAGSEGRQLCSGAERRARMPNETKSCTLGAAKQATSATIHSHGFG